MTKPFSEVIPGLQTSAHLMELLPQMKISRVTMPRDRSMLRIYMECDQLIPKRDILVLEAAIKRQFFAKKPVRIKIYERYHLDQMTAQEAMSSYRESILLELKQYHLIEYNLFRRARIRFTEPDLLLLEAEDTLVNRSRAQELCRILEKIFIERLGISLEVRIRLKEGIVQTAANREEEKAAMDASRIVEQARKAAEEEASAISRAEEKKEYHRHPKGKLLDPSQGFGRDFQGESIPISQIQEEMGEVILNGQVIKQESRELRTGNTIVIFVVTDFTDSITVKYFATPEQRDELLRLVAVGEWICVQGSTIMDRYDRELTIGNVKGIKKSEPQKGVRQDNSPRKRVELHCHTKMSDMDGMSDAKSIIRQAAAWGHSAVAITDHGVVQAFPEAMHAAEKSKIKVIYGCEGYLVDDGPEDTVESIAKAKTYHIILLAQNDIGRSNQSRLISASHLNYFHSSPRIPRSLLNRYREGLILGSACEAGEVMRAILNREPQEEVARRVNFYDYLEIQPTGNNEFMLRDGKYEWIKTKEDLQTLNQQVIDWGERFDKPVVATGDVHFLHPEDEIYRRILMKGKGFDDADLQPPLYFHTTEEMLEEFSSLGREKAEEVVITNPGRIADSCEPILPVRMDKCPPVIEGSEQELREMCYGKAKSLYGDPLPEIVAQRLEKELSSIIGNGYAVMYIIAQRLVKKSYEDGYLVGSRGSVGSSLAATMSDITEVNPLSPHYRCPSCFYSDFDSPGVRAYGGGAGCDMPDMDCPRCGTRLIKDGFDIPFESFLGFK